MQQTTFWWWKLILKKMYWLIRKFLHGLEWGFTMQELAIPLIQKWSWIVYSFLVWMFLSPSPSPLMFVHIVYIKIHYVHFHFILLHWDYIQIKILFDFGYLKIVFFAFLIVICNKKYWYEYDVLNFFTKKNKTFFISFSLG